MSSSYTGRDGVPNLVGFSDFHHGRLHFYGSRHFTARKYTQMPFLNRNRDYEVSAIN